MGPLAATVGLPGRRGLQRARGARRAHSHSGLGARNHAAGTHRSRVPRCGAGPPVMTGPPAPASRSPRAHCSGSLHGRADDGAGFSASRHTRCSPRPHSSQTGIATRPVRAKRARPPHRLRALERFVPLAPTSPWASPAGPPPPASRGTPLTACPLHALGIVSEHPGECRVRSLWAFSRRGLSVYRARPKPSAIEPSRCRRPSVLPTSAHHRQRRVQRQATAA
jgi:hypothetical protein